MDSVFRLAFSDIPNSGIESHHTGDHQGVGHAARQQGDTGSNAEEGYGEGGKLLQEYAETRTRDSFWWEIRAVSLQETLCCSLGEPGVLCSVEGRTDFLSLYDMPWDLTLRFRLRYCPTDGSAPGHCGVGRRERRSRASTVRADIVRPRPVTGTYSVRVLCQHIAKQRRNGLCAGVRPKQDQDVPGERARGDFLDAIIRSKS
jgi:hypothetical protein